ncbi:MAG: UDP-N-acetylmuramate--alanine ligase [Paludibacteraceae bacterium]|nr:UDP-N-acetylmuramate--alanine ligase [Paludibacteraceae bacterium]
MNLNNLQSFFFVGAAGTGMSAIAQYLAGKGKQVAGSDRQFAQGNTEIKKQLERAGIACHPQDGSGITATTQAVVVSTAIETTNPEYQKALALGIPVIKRSELLAMISDNARTIAVGGTSGKSTTTAMIFHILQQCGCDPSLITGAGLTRLQADGRIGNAYVGQSDWLVIEADESDGSIVGYHPEIAVLLNMERDHKEMEELETLFATFKAHTHKAFVVNADNAPAARLSAGEAFEFSTRKPSAGVCGSGFKQEGFSIAFQVNGLPCSLPLIGRHNMENALAALAVCCQAGVALQNGIRALAGFDGIYRRTQLVGHDSKRDIYVIDDFAHNPSEVACAIRACQAVAPQVTAYFQPHGYGPLRFMHEDLARETAEALREQDVLVVSDVYYAGGTVDRNIESDVVSNAVLKAGKQAVYTGNREETLQWLASHAVDHSVVLVMGARDPRLPELAKQVLERLA